MLKAPWYSPEEDVIFTAYAAECEEESAEPTMEDLAARYCIPLAEFKYLWCYEFTDEQREELIANF